MDEGEEEGGGGEGGGKGGAKVRGVGIVARGGGRRLSDDCK